MFFGIVSAQGDSFQGGTSTLPRYQPETRVA